MSAIQHHSNAFDEFQIGKCTSSSLCNSVIADRLIAVQSPKQTIDGLFVRSIDLISEVKDKIKEQLSYRPGRLILNVKLLADSATLGECGIVPGTFLRAAKGKQNLKKRRQNHGPGSDQRKRAKAKLATPKQAKERLDELLAQMTPEGKSSLLKQLAEDDKPTCDDATEDLETGFEDTSTSFADCETSLDNGQNVNDGPGAGEEASDRHAMGQGREACQ